MDLERAMRTGARSLLGVAAASAVALGAAGCSGNGSGPQMGQASASMQDNPQASSPDQRTSGQRALAATSGSGSFSGTLTGDAKAEIKSSSGAWVDLGSLSQASLSLQDASSEAVVSQSTTVDAGSYVAVRLVLTNVHAHLDAGSTFGSTSLSSSADVAVGGSDDSVTVTKQIQVDVSQGATTRVVFDLNTETWFDSTSVQNRVVADSKVQSAVQAASRSSVTAG